MNLSMPAWYLCWRQTGAALSNALSVPGEWHPKIWSVGAEFGQPGQPELGGLRADLDVAGRTLDLDRSGLLARGLGGEGEEEEGREGRADRQRHGVIPGRPPFFGLAPGPP